MIEPAKDTLKVQSMKSLLKRKPLAFAMAGVFGLGIAGAALAPHAPFALAQTQSAQDSIVTPYGRAPITFADLAQKVSPAVVSIQVKNGESRTASPRGMPPGFEIPELPEDHPLHDFFERFRKEGPGESPRRRPSLAQGSGFIVSADGYVVTNDHVVGKASEILVTMDNGDKHDAEIIGTDSRTDLALLKIKADKEFPFVEFSDKTARVGDWVLAVGNPFGLGGTVTAGIISAHNRDIGSSPYDYLQIDAAVNRGNSGGPAFSLDGKVIGVNTAIFSPSGGNVGIAFAVPAELAKEVVDELKSKGKVSRGWLGVTIQSVNEDIASSLGLDQPKGALVTNLTEDGPAAKSKMEVGDLIVSVEGEEIGDSRDLARKIAGYDPDNTVTVTVVRDGEERNIEVELGSFPASNQLADLQRDEPTPQSGEEMKDLGLSLAPASAQAGPGSKGVVIMNIDPDSKAAEKGLKVGDVILEVAGAEVNQPTDVAEGVRKAKDKGRSAVHMLVRSGETQRFVALPLKKV